MTNRDKSVLAKICKQSNSLSEVILESHDSCVICSMSTIKKYWKIFGKKEQKDCYWRKRRWIYTYEHWQR